MPIPPSELSILASTGQPRRVRALADANALPYPTAYAAVRELEDKGLVFTLKDGKHRVVRSATPALPGLAQSLMFEAPRQDLAKIFHGDRLLQFHALDRIKNPRLAAEVSGITPRALYQTIEEFAPSGFLVRTSEGFELHPRQANYRAFIDEVAKIQALANVHKYSQNAVLLWNLGPEALFKTREPVEGPHIQPAGFDRFDEYGIPLLSAGYHTYHLAPRPLGPSDAILEAILAHGDTPIHRTYCSLLYEKTKPDDLRDKAKIYELTDLATALIAYVEDKQDTDGFLPWKEHERYRNEYGLAP